MNEKRYHYYFGHILYSLFLDPFCLAHCIGEFEVRDGDL